MPVNPFTTYDSNERVIAIPPIPTKSTAGSITAASTVVIDFITLSAANLAAGTVYAYLYYAYLFPNATAAASAVATAWQWQFRTAAHANVGAAVAVIRMTAGWNGAAAVGIGTLPRFEPPSPFLSVLTIPATAAEVALQRATNLAGAGIADCAEGWGIDLINSGSPGDIGSGGMVAQSATNPNTF